MNYVDFGRRVKHLRKEQGITQEELALNVGISASFLGHIERGTRVASLETLVKLCHALNTHPNHLLAFYPASGRSQIAPTGARNVAR